MRPARGMPFFSGRSGLDEDYHPSKPPVLLLDSEDGAGSLSRRRFNYLAIGEAVLLPCAIFTGTLALLSFSLGVEHKALAAFIVIIGFLVALALALRALSAARARGGAAGRGAEPTWLLFLAATCLLAWIAGLVLGKVNFAARMKPYYDMAIMGTATNVDPQDIPATKYMDASRIVFAEGSHVAEELSLGYKDGDVYCAAPIVGNSSQRMASYDFWAVGINCCSPVPPAKFWCGSAEPGDPKGHGGIRWLGAAGLFDRAIEQAEAEYGIKAANPLLYTWSRDPIGEIDDLRERGTSFVATAAVIHLVAQTFLVMCMLSAHTTLGARCASALRSLVGKEEPSEFVPFAPDEPGMAPSYSGWGAPGAGGGGAVSAQPHFVGYSGMLGR